jgi:hypothetical protein
VSGDVLVHQAQEEGIETVRAGFGRDDYDNHKGIKRLRWIELIVDAIGFIDRFVEFDALLAGRSDGDEDRARVGHPTLTNSKSIMAPRFHILNNLWSSCPTVNPARIQLRALWRTQSYPALLQSA